MSAPKDGSQDLRTGAFATFFTLLLHALCSFAIASPAVLAPVASRDLGLPAATVGVVVGLLFFAQLPTGLMTGYVFGRLSERRVCQMIAVFVSVGFAIGAALGLASSRWALPLVYAGFVLLMGALFGCANGFVNTMGAQLMFRSVPARMLSIATSVKQTAVPVGGMAAGLLLPWMLLTVSWTVALAIVSAFAAAVALVIQGLPLADTPESDRRTMSVGALLAPVRIIWDSPSLRELAFVAIAFNAYQLSLLGYFVTYLNIEIGLSLVAAGSVFAAMQFTAIIGRVAWGASADFFGNTRRQLGLIAFINVATSLAIASFSSSWPIGALVAVSVIAGGTAVSWNGMYLAETARLAPEGKVGLTAGGIIVFLSLGGLLGPGLFALIASLTGTYHLGFLLFAVPLLVAGLLLLMPPRWRRAVQFP